MRLVALNEINRRIDQPLSESSTRFDVRSARMTLENGCQSKKLPETVWTAFERINRFVNGRQKGRNRI
jgi:hypothetical protein